MPLARSHFVSLIRPARSACRTLHGYGDVWKLGNFVIDYLPGLFRADTDARFKGEQGQAIFE